MHFAKFLTNSSPYYPDHNADGNIRCTRETQVWVDGAFQSAYKKIQRRRILHQIQRNYSHPGVDQYQPSRPRRVVFCPYFPIPVVYTVFAHDLITLISPLGVILLNSIYWRSFLGGQALIMNQQMHPPGANLYHAIADRTGGRFPIFLGPVRAFCKLKSLGKIENLVSDYTPPPQGGGG